MIRKFSLIALVLISIISCEQKQSKAEADYIKNLEEKNQALERELQEEKSKPPIIIERPAQPVVTTREENNSYSATSKDYFTIGSTEDEVIEVMGDPSSLFNIGMGMKQFMYGLSSVSFQDGKVESYSNASKNLKVKMRR